MTTETVFPSQGWHAGIARTARRSHVRASSTTSATVAPSRFCTFVPRTQGARSQGASSAHSLASEAGG
ncbi:MAG: hypothetical protein M3188_02460 [Actinomycetota bacterium]|nr:hypothetical protein [Actinomycetota bacterium]